MIKEYVCKRCGRKIVSDTAAVAYKAKLCPPCFLAAEFAPSLARTLERQEAEKT